MILIIKICHFGHLSGKELMAICTMKRVLIVEDDLSLGWLLKKILDNKYEVVIKNSGEEALLWLSVQPFPDLIISDIKMPGMNGVALLEYLSNSALYRNIPVIIISGFDDPCMRKRCLDLGALTYLVKPFEPQKLLNEMDRPTLWNQKRRAKNFGT